MKLKAITVAAEAGDEAEVTRLLAAGDNPNGVLEMDIIGRRWSLLLEMDMPG